MTEVVLSKTLETVRFLNDALEPGEDVRVDTPVNAAPSAPAKQPSRRPPELGDLEATAQATARSTRPVGTRLPRAAMRRKTTTADPAPASHAIALHQVVPHEVVHEGGTQANDCNDDEQEDDPQRVAYAARRRVTALTPGPTSPDSWVDSARRQPLFRPRRRTRSVP